MRRPILLLTILLTLACGGPEEHAEQAAAEPMAPADVMVETLRASMVRQETVAVGSVEARNTARIASKILANITQVYVNEGDRVDSGRSLIELDDRDLRARLDAALAGQAEAESAIAAADQAIAAAEAQSELAELTHKRFSDLLAKESVSQQEYDEVNARLRGARAGVEAATAHRRQGESKLAQAEASIQTAQIALGYARIASPVAGVVVKRMADPGSLAAPGQPLLEIEQSGDYRLAVAAPESLLGTVAAGDELRIALDALGERGSSAGRIIEIVPEVDPGSRTFIVKIGLPQLPGVRSGLYGRAFLPGEEVETLTLPARAVVERGQLHSVFVVEDGVAHRRLITVGDEREGRVAALSGLNAGESVVLNPQAVSDGQPVRVSEAGP